MIDKSLESVFPLGVRMGPNKALELNCIDDVWGPRYEGYLKVEGYANVFRKLKPVGEPADFSCENLKNLKSFLQGYPLKVSNNFFYFRISNMDEFPVESIARVIVSSVSKYVKFGKFDGVLDCSYQVIEKSLKVESSFGAYRVTFDMLVSMKSLLDDLSFYRMFVPFPVRNTLKFYMLLREFMEYPEVFDFVFDKENLIVVKYVDFFKRDYLLMQKLRFEKNGFGVWELGSLFAEFHPDDQKRKILKDFFRDGFGCKDFCEIFPMDLKFPYVKYNVEIEFSASVCNGDFVESLEKGRNNLQSSKTKLRQSMLKNGDVCGEKLSFKNSLSLNITCSKKKSNLEWKQKISSGEHLKCVEEWLQKGVAALDTLLGILKVDIFVGRPFDNERCFFYLRQFVRRIVTETIKLTPMDYIDYDSSALSFWCEEVHNYAKKLLNGADCF